MEQYLSWYSGVSSPQFRLPRWPRRPCRGLLATGDGIELLSIVGMAHDGYYPRGHPCFDEAKERKT